MNLSEDEIIEKYGKNAVIVIEIPLFHMNMNGHAFYVDIIKPTKRCTL